MAVQHFEKFESLAADLSRFVQTWHPENSQGVILIVHGLGEHTGRYSGLAKWLAEHGFLVRVFDQQGHGKDSRQRGCIDSYDALVNEIASLVSWSRHQTDLPHFLLGHSLRRFLCCPSLAHQSWRL